MVLVLKKLPGSKFLQQARLRSLLEKNREATLSETEIAELDLYEQLAQLMILLKARFDSLK